MRDKKQCPNMNHGRMNPPINCCPSCGEKFKSTAIRACDEAKHKERRKQRDSFCCDCGKSLKL